MGFDVQNSIGDKAYSSLYEAPGYFSASRPKTLAEDKRNRIQTRRLFAKYCAEGNTAKLKYLAQFDPNVVQCEVCGLWYYKTDNQAENICADCADFDETDTHGASKTCNWCGKKFQRTKRWASTRFCCEECRQLDLSVRIRQKNRAARQHKNCA